MNDTASPPPEASNSRRAGLSPRVKLRLVIAVIVVLVAIAIWLVHYEIRGKYLEGTDDAYIEADAVTVSPKISGYVEQVFVTDNQDVKAGQPLVRIDARDYTAQAAQYRAQIDVAQANADNVRAGIREQEAAIQQARAQLSADRADAQFAAGEVARYAPLAESGAETREKLTTLRNQATQAAGTVLAQTAMLAQAERRVGSLKAQVRQAQAQGEAGQRAAGCGRRQSRRHGHQGLGRRAYRRQDACGAASSSRKARG